MARTMETPSSVSRDVVPVRRVKRGGPPLVQFYRSAIGKKWVMGVTGVILMLFVLVHMIGNLKLFLSKSELNLYGEALRDMPGTCSRAPCCCGRFVSASSPRSRSTSTPPRRS